MVIKVDNKKAKQVKNKINEKKYSYAFGSYQQMNDEELINYSYMYEKIPENKNEYESYYSRLIFYKNEKANRKKNMKKQKVKNVLLYNFLISHFMSV